MMTGDFVTHDTLIVLAVTLELGGNFGGGAEDGEYIITFGLIIDGVLWPCCAEQVGCWHNIIALCFMLCKLRSTENTIGFEIYFCLILLTFYSKRIPAHIESSGERVYNHSVKRHDFISNRFHERTNYHAVC